jgi:hypothetical protein
MKILRMGVALLAYASLFTGAIVAAAQEANQQQTSLGDVARRLRAQKKDQAKPARVWDNDNIPKTPSAVSIVGQAALPPDQPTPATSEESKQSADESGKPTTTVPAEQPAAGAEAGKQPEIAAAEAALAEAKAKLQGLRSDLDLLERQLKLDQDQYYGKPDFASDTEGKAKLDAEAAQVDSKRLEVTAAEQKVSELQSKLDELKIPAKTEPPSA